MDLNEENIEKCLYASFNQDSSCFCIGTNKGFRIYNSFPLKCHIKREIQGGVGIIEVLNRTNFFIFVGTGNNPKLSQQKIILWDENKSKVIKELILLYDIKNIKIKRTKIFAICERKIIVFTLGNFEKIDSIETFPNKNGIFGISLDPDLYIISYLSKDIGKIKIKNYNEKKDEKYLIKEISAHQSEIVALTMNYEGTLIASVSEKGTLIKIFRIKDSCLIQELRRGTEPAEIYSLNFDLKSLYISCSSNKGTIHIFNIINKENINEKHNQKSIFGTVVSYFGIKNEYLNSEWSFAQYRINCKDKSIVSFCTENNYVVVITYDGIYHQGSFNPKAGGECNNILEENFLEMEIEKED